VGRCRLQHDAVSAVMENLLRGIFSKGSEIFSPIWNLPRLLHVRHALRVFRSRYPAGYPLEMQIVTTVSFHILIEATDANPGSDVLEISLTRRNERNLHPQQYTEQCVASVSEDYAF